MTDIKKKLQDEITALEYELRNELPKEILKARAHGDLKENAEYHAAKERQGFVNARMNQLKQRLAEWSMIDFSKIPRDRVGLGSRVVLLALMASMTVFPHCYKSAAGGAVGPARALLACLATRALHLHYGS